MRTTAPTLAILASVVLAACKDDSPTVVPPDPTSFALTLPDTAYAGQAFELTVTAVASNGTTPDATFSGDVALSVAGGTVSPATLTVVAGVGQQSVTLTDLAGTATISASLGSISGSANLLVVGLEPVASVQIVPGSFLFTDASQTRQLAAWAFDSNGNPTQATFTWSSSDPGLVDVDAAGLATSGSGLGSTEVFAEADGVQSDPATALLEGSDPEAAGDELEPCIGHRGLRGGLAA